MGNWTPNKVAQMLRAIKNYPILYDRTHDLSETDEYIAATEDMENIVNEPWPEIMKKFNNLRNYLKVCYNKQLKYNVKPKWIYYDLMDYAIDSKIVQSAGQEDPHAEDEEPSFKGFKKTDVREPISQGVRRSTRKCVPKRRKSCSALSQPGSQQARKSRRVTISTTKFRHLVEDNPPLTFTEGVENNENHVLTSDSVSDHLDLISFKLRDIDQRFGQQEGKLAALTIFECLSRFEKEATARYFAN